MRAARAWGRPTDSFSRPFGLAGLVVGDDEGAVGQLVDAVDRARRTPTVRPPGSVQRRRRRSAPKRRSDGDDRDRSPRAARRGASSASSAASSCGAVVDPERGAARAPGVARARRRPPAPACCRAASVHGAPAVRARLRQLAVEDGAVQPVDGVVERRAPVERAELLDRRPAPRSAGRRARTARSRRAGSAVHVSSRVGDTARSTADRRRGRTRLPSYTVKRVGGPCVAQGERPAQHLVGAGDGQRRGRPRRRGRWTHSSRSRCSAADTGNSVAARPWACESTTPRRRRRVERAADRAETGARP